MFDTEAPKFPLSIFFSFLAVLNIEVTVGLFSLIFFLGGSLIFSLGILCEYLKRILDATTNRPIYVIEELTKRPRVEIAK